MSFNGVDADADADAVGFKLMLEFKPVGSNWTQRLCRNAIASVGKADRVDVSLSISMESWTQFNISCDVSV